MNANMTSNSSPTTVRASKYFSTYLTVILFLVTFAFGFFVGQAWLLKKDVTNAQAQVKIEDVINLNRTTTHANTVDFYQFWQVWDMVKDKYVKKNDIKETEMFYGAIQGMVAGLGDPYSVYFPPQAAEEFTKDLSGELEGIGAEIGVRNNQLIVISPLPNSPAEKAGLLPGDKILFINTDSTAGMDVSVAVGKIRGKAKTVVALTINRNGKTRDYAIVRAKINVPAVTYALKKGNIGYVRVMQFNDSTMPEFEKAIKKIKDQKVKGIILDLRNNPGGYLQTAVDMASEWVESGAIVSEKNVEGQNNVQETSGNHRLSSYKTVVLVNKGSASASEIVAGALQDHGKATLLGEQTFGKGSVQDYQNFRDGSALKLTVAEWFTPNGKNLNKAGIVPNVVFKQDYDKEKPGQDTMLDKALTLFKVAK